MKQVLLRVPDDVHARLVARAARQERSMNALVTEILEDVLEDEPGDARARVRARARARGSLVERPAPGVVPDRQAVLDSMRGLGPVVAALFDEGR